MMSFLLKGRSMSIILDFFGGWVGCFFSGETSSLPLFSAKKPLECNELLPPGKVG